MADEDLDVTRTDGTPTPTPTPTGRPSATSRARRIGGRPTAAATADAPTTNAPPKPSRPAPPPPPATRRTPRLADDPEPSADAAAGTAPGTAKRAKRRDPDRTVAWLTWAPAAVLTAGVIAMAVVIAIVSHGVWWGQRYNAPSRTNPLRDQVAAAAKTCLARTNSYDYRNLDAFETAGLACTAGKETDQFRQAVEKIIKVNAPKLKAVQSAQINTTGIESVSGGQWTLLVYGQLKVTNTSTPNSRVDPFAAEVRMEQAHGKWVITAEKVVSQPVS